MFIICPTHTDVQWEALQVHIVSLYKKMLFFIASLMKIKSYRSHNPYQVVQESCMHTTPEHAIKLKVRKIKSISQYQTVRGKYHFNCLLPLEFLLMLLLHIPTLQTTTFSCITLYYADTFYITTWLYATWHTKFRIWTHSHTFRSSQRNGHVLVCVARYQIISVWGSGTEITHMQVDDGIISWIQPTLLKK